MTVVPSPFPVLEHRLVGYRRTWRGSVFSSFVVPVLFFVGMGISVGAYVNRAGALGVPYLDYIAPGLLASTALQLAMAESSWPVLGAFEWNRIYHGMRATPLRAGDLVLGEMLFIQVRVAVAVTAFLGVMTIFGTVHSWRAVAVVPVALLLAAAACSPVLAFSASIRTDNMFALLYRFGVIPMTLFAGVFFPVSAMPEAARWLAYISPLWHGVELCRSATLGAAMTAPLAIHVGYLATWAVGGYVLARARYARRLID
jgi:lipooligosaccharide transport system permease protein